MSIAVRTATADDRNAVIATIVAAFTDDPAFRYFFGTDPGYAVAAPLFAAYLFDVRVGQNTVWVTDDVSAVALWDQPASRPKPQGFAAYKAELFRQITRDIGPATARILGYDKPVEALLPTTDFWYLGILASHPNRRGEGLARTVAEHGLAQAGADDTPAYLETTNADNVRLYQGAGWTVTDSLVVEPDLPVWILRHDGRMMA